MGTRGGGGKRGNDNGLAMIAGSVGAAILDFMMNGMGTQPVGYISGKGGKRVPITTSDYIQMVFSAGTGLYGFTRGGSGSRMPAFAFGMAMTQVITKYFFPTFGIPRYFIADIDSSGRLVKIG